MNIIFPLIYSIFVLTCASASTPEIIHLDLTTTASNLVNVNRTDAITKTMYCYADYFTIPTDFINNNTLWNNVVANVEIIINNILTKEYNMSEECKKLETILCVNKNINDVCFKHVKKCTLEIYKYLFVIKNDKTNKIWRSMIRPEKDLIFHSMEYYENALKNIKED
ncbi:uncharacterized protein LOC126896905 isoform X1 [Daktulosphaira vitifoliae]|uniref:uncharacterized protein LOC126896905 isoform X1 n=1 Tax=Daktulosphaira vitifoliae TaxID=58002 RepID=UPI0021AABCE7|nr:uncharacterized protein LOC126896905 isoform X1 [Daktulosphaira vitifoliae]